ncbi:hypothetical protein AKJ16_DCAP09698 [Drosera capensis]
MLSLEPQFRLKSIFTKWLIRDHIDWTHQMSRGSCSWLRILGFHIFNGIADFDEGTHCIDSLPKYCILLKWVCTRTSSPLFECTLLEGMPTWIIFYKSSGDWLKIIQPVLQTAVNVSISIFFLLITNQYEDAISDKQLEVVRAGAIAFSKACLANRRISSHCNRNCRKNT